MNNFILDHSGLFTSNSDHYATPKYIYDWFINHGFIDPCPLFTDYDSCPPFYVGDKIFCNPPYSKMALWIDYCVNWCIFGCKVFLLVPNRSDSRWFEKAFRYCTDLIIITGRLSFNDTGKLAPFPSIIMILNLSDDLFNGFRHVHIVGKEDLVKFLDNFS